MKSPIATVVVAVLLGASIAADELTANPMTLACAKKVYEQGQLVGRSRGEAGASMSLNEGGGLICHRITWSIAGGAVEIKVPRGAIAVIHTHPPQTRDWPSREDAALARRLGIPVYTLQPYGIWRVDRAGKISKEASRGWIQRAGRAPAKVAPPPTAAAQRPLLPLALVRRQSTADSADPAEPRPR